MTEGPPHPARGPLVALWFAGALAVLVWAVTRHDPRPWVPLLLACAPLLTLGLPALLLLRATRRRGDPYDVSDRYNPPGR